MLRKRNQACHFNCAFNNRTQELVCLVQSHACLVNAGILKIAFLMPEFHCTSLHNKTFKKIRPHILAFDRANGRGVGQLMVNFQLTSISSNCSSNASFSFCRFCLSLSCLETTGWRSLYSWKKWNADLTVLRKAKLGHVLHENWNFSSGKWLEI